MTAQVLVFEARPSTAHPMACLVDTTTHRPPVEECDAPAHAARP